MHGPAQAVGDLVHITAHIFVQEVFGRPSPESITRGTGTMHSARFFNPGLFRHELELEASPLPVLDADAQI
jgi:hypothetical protein